MKKVIGFLAASLLCFSMAACTPSNLNSNSSNTSTDSSSYSSSDFSSSSSGSSSYSYNDDSSDSSECYVCGEPASTTYGSYDYCTSCYSLVKGSTEALEDSGYDFDDYDYDYGSGYSYDSDDDYYSDNDHNDDGLISDNEFQDALGDYMDDLLENYNYYD